MVIIEKANSRSFIDFSVANSLLLWEVSSEARTKLHFGAAITS